MNGLLNVRSHRKVDFSDFTVVRSFYGYAGKSTETNQFLLEVVSIGPNKHQNFLSRISSMRTTIFGPRPFFATAIFAFRPRKVLETFLIQQNVRNCHIYIQLMKQHMT